MMMMAKLVCLFQSLLVWFRSMVVLAPTQHSEPELMQAECGQGAGPGQLLVAD